MNAFAIVLLSLLAVAFVCVAWDVIGLARFDRRRARFLNEVYDEVECEHGLFDEFEPDHYERHGR